MDFDLVDDFVQVTDKAAMQMTRRLAKEEGLFVGQCCGMALAGALDWCRAHRDTLTPESVVVVLLPDSGFRYLSKTFNDEWMRRNGFFEEAQTLTLDDVLAARKTQEPVVAVAPDATLAEAIAMMMQHGISQMPVLDGATVVGSPRERGVLNHLIGDAGARDRPVRDVMAAPLPVVRRSVHLDNLTATLDGEAGAVLVQDDVSGDGAPPAAFHIITRSDLIAALAAAGRQRGAA